MRAQSLLILVNKTTKTATMSVWANPASPCREWWSRAAEDKKQPEAFSRLAVYGLVVLSEQGAHQLWAWGKTIPGWDDGPLLMG